MSTCDYYDENGIRRRCHNEECDRLRAENARLRAENERLRAESKRCRYDGGH
jgi:cell division protein FtsB